MFRQDEAISYLQRFSLFIKNWKIHFCKTWSHWSVLNSFMLSFLFIYCTVIVSWKFKFNCVVFPYISCLLTNIKSCLLYLVKRNIYFRNLLERNGTMNVNKWGFNFRTRTKISISNSIIVFFVKCVRRYSTKTFCRTC